MPTRTYLYIKWIFRLALISSLGIAKAAAQQPTVSETTAIEMKGATSGETNSLDAQIKKRTTSKTEVVSNKTTLRLPTQSGNPLWNIPLTTLTATRERPLFSRSRRPPPALPKSEPNQSSVASEPQLVLVGAIAGEEDGVAIFLDSQTKSVIRLKTGQSHFGWTLQEVKARQAILQKGQKTAALTIPNLPGK